MLSESLVRRMPGCSSICAAIVSHALEGSFEESDDGGLQIDGPWASADQSQSNSAVTGAAASAEAGTGGAEAAGQEGSQTSVGASSGAGGSALPPLRVFRPVAEVRDPAARLALAALLCPRAAVALEETDIVAYVLKGNSQGIPTGSNGGSLLPERARGLVQRLLEPEWPLAAFREWVLSVAPRQGSYGESAGGVQGPGGVQAGGAIPGLGSRMYVQHADGEMRIALTLVSG